MKRPALQYQTLLFIFLSVLYCTGCNSKKNGSTPSSHELDSFLITKDELVLKYSHAPGDRQLSFSNAKMSPEKWRNVTSEKLKELLQVSKPDPCSVVELRRTRFQGITIHALVITIGESLSVPAYLLIPAEPEAGKSAVMAIHGHGSVEPCIGLYDDYHHFFALELAKAGHMVLAPELRGFSTLSDLAHQVEINRLDYWVSHSQFTLATDEFLYGSSMIGQTVMDLLRWEDWFCEEFGIEELDVTGISYGGDLAIIYPAFSKRVRKIFASGTMGSFSAIFQRCYNAPAHCIPGILQWMDRSDIAGLNAPRPITIHFGELDVPGETNASASYNETAPQSMKELREIYRAFNAENEVHLVVTPGSHHEMDIPALLDFLCN